MLPESLHLGQRTLEDVFLELTGRELARERHPTGCSRPRPGAAPLARQVLAQAGDGVAADAAQRRAAAAGRGDPGDRADRRRRGRARTSASTFSRRPVDVFAPGVLALAVMSTAFTSLAIATGFERRYGVIKRLGSSPLPRSGLLLGKVGALLLVEVLQVVVISRGRAGPRLAAARRRCSAALLTHRPGHRGLRLARAVRGRRAAGRGDARGGQPGLPAADGRRGRRTPLLGVRRLRRRHPAAALRRPRGRPAHAIWSGEIAVGLDAGAARVGASSGRP